MIPPTPTVAKRSRKPSFIVEDNGLDVFYPGDYEHIKFLQRGAQGSVELVSTKFYKCVALKKFDQKISQWETAAIREMSTLLKSLIHPNIVHTRGVLFASPTERDVPMGVLMEFMDGGSVFDAIYDPVSVYPITTPLNWCRQAASGLAFLHRHKLIHRDVKPGNMLLCDGGKTLKISDFGLCTRAVSEMTADVGTVIYKAPEVITCHETRVVYDEKCDVFSLGISFWEMLHRRQPHGGVALFIFMTSVRLGKRPKIDTNLCFQDLEKLIQSMWAEKSSNRPNIDEVYEELKLMLDSLGFVEN